ncbi:MAG: class I SAM-dependent methyltransferase [Chloroflexi bacterium]|nr:class I SAM-dependent methyltransferase [Chloroflexota bacterium]
MPALNSLRLRFLRWAFYHFYNSFAFTYDFVSAVISLGHWRSWCDAAIPHLRGARVLEIAFGTGSLQLDMRAANIEPFGADLSLEMARITAGKLRRAGHRLRLARASVLALPYPAGTFDSLVLTFPPNFLQSPQAITEMARVLAPGGRIVIVDAGWLDGPPALGALINLAFRFTGTSDIGDERARPLRQAGFDVQVLRTGDARSHAQVLIATKNNPIPLKGGNDA